MNNSYIISLYSITVILFAVSLIKDKSKTKRAFKKSWKMFTTVLPQFLGILLLISLVLSFTDTEIIKTIIGEKTGFKGMIITSFLGSISLIPVLIAFPIVSELIQNGAGVIQTTVFITTLTTVGFVTLPLEKEFFGVKIAILRNSLFYISSFISALLLGVLMK